MNDTKDLKFDEALFELETIIRNLEAGNLPLEESIELYKKGMTLSVNCHQKLTQIEEEFVKLIDPQGKISNFNESEN